ncbi:MAG: hypothetical protein JW891_02180 [Candidatus Lokiarchaeota archaeon]|nr:hypothetical protein [Candidatus Lokiarchaeota archaeon]
MNSEKFVKQLNEVQDLMKDEKYKEAIVILEKLKIIEKKGEFDYTLTHKLYQLISNAHSLFNQQNIVKIMQELMIQKRIMPISELNELINQRTELEMKDSEFRRELEILILRGILPYNIEGDLVIF